MKFSTALPGRIFVIRLEHGEIIHEQLEAFARERGIGSASVSILGGIDAGSTLVVGPADTRALPARPIELRVDDAREAVGAGTIFPDEAGRPVLHMHIAAGRGGDTVTGCVRRGVKTWHVLEVIVTELTGLHAQRVHDPATGFALLEPGGKKK